MPKFIFLNASLYAFHSFKDCESYYALVRKLTKVTKPMLTRYPYHFLFCSTTKRTKIPRDSIFKIKHMLRKFLSSQKNINA